MRLVGHLLLQAGERLRSMALSAAASMWGVPVQDLRYEDGRVRDPAGQRVAGLGEIAAHIGREGIPGHPEERRFYVDAEFNGRIAAHPTGTAVCELEIDPETGDVEIVRYTSIDDVGRPINPLIVEGQVHGGLAQGIGQAFLEDYHVDPESGQIFSGSYMDYGVARAGAIPRRFDVELTEDRTHGNALGSRAAARAASRRPRPPFSTRWPTRCARHHARGTAHAGHPLRDLVGHTTRTGSTAMSEPVLVRSHSGLLDIVLNTPGTAIS